ncbi:MAG TPA: hypothetical protein VNN10_10160 [Dehalococcoidia bacterium]|nr:hypothetical protein [Dehalococcoidia bacterium]
MTAAVTSMSTRSLGTSRGRVRAASRGDRRVARGDALAEAMDGLIAEVYGQALRHTASITDAERVTREALMKAEAALRRGASIAEVRQAALTATARRLRAWRLAQTRGSALASARGALRRAFLLGLTTVASAQVGFFLI